MDANCKCTLIPSISKRKDSDIQGTGPLELLGYSSVFSGNSGDRHGYSRGTSTNIPLSNEWSNGAIRSEYQSMSRERSTLQSDTSPTAFLSQTITSCVDVSLPSTYCASTTCCGLTRR